MTNDELRKLRDGDIIRNTITGNAYTVLRNVGHCVIATRTLEVTNAPEWEHVYTSTPYLPPPIAPLPPPAQGISLVERVAELEKIGWTFSVKPHQWISPDGVFRTELLHSAWLFRNDYPKPFKGEIPHLFEDRRRDLLAAGWIHSGPLDWRSPSGEYFRGSGPAWVAMKNIKPVKSFTSFAEARTALRDAGWINPYGKTWRSPSGDFFDGARAAYAALTGGGNPS